MNIPTFIDQIPASMFLFITWDVSPEIFSAGNFTLRWYSFLMATAFLVCYYLAGRMVKREGYPAKIQDNGTVYFVVGLIIGARLGHCLFYEPSFYLQHPLEMLNVWKGGLSSHGAVLGIMGGMYVYALKVKIPWFWFIDKLAVVFILAGSFVRIGNLMNSEIYGTPTAVPWGFVFVRRGEDFARHPAQLYESLIYLALFLGLWYFHRRNWNRLQPGFFTGLSLILVFIARFLIEFLKESPEVISQPFSLTMGQLLSLPLILLGSWLTWQRRGRVECDGRPE
jgi:prolipoprotein diacylglyceryl transferase